MTPVPKSQTLDGLAKQFTSSLSFGLKKPNVFNYDPGEEQEQFHRSQKKGRMLIGGNRSGKTVAGNVEAVLLARGQSPFGPVPEPPTTGRIVTVDFKNGWAKIIKPVLRQWLPPSSLINGSWEDSWDGKDHMLTLANGSTIEIMSHDQDLESFAGVPRHWIYFDEECSKDIYKECMLRLADYGGRWWMCLTPVDGMDWSYEEIYEPVESLNFKHPLIDIIQVDTLKNKHLTRESLMEVLEGLSEEEIEVRRKGNYVAFGGLIFSDFTPSQHSLPMDTVPPATWRHFRSFDHGFANPSAWMFHAVSPDGLVVTYDEHYKAEMTIKEHASVILEKEDYYRKKFGIVPYLSIADPAIEQRQATTGHSIRIEYSQQGINLALGQLRNVDAGLDRMVDYLRNNRWFITENCVNLRKEMKQYRRGRYGTSKAREQNNKKETPQKKNDHAIDSSRYFFSFMPDLSLKKPEEVRGFTLQEVGKMIGAGTAMPGPRVDRRLLSLEKTGDPDYFNLESTFIGGEY